MDGGQLFLYGLVYVLAGKTPERRPGVYPDCCRPGIRVCAHTSYFVGAFAEPGYLLCAAHRPGHYPVPGFGAQAVFVCRVCRPGTAVLWFVVSNGVWADSHFGVPADSAVGARRPVAAGCRYCGGRGCCGVVRVTLGHA